MRRKMPRTQSEVRAAARQLEVADPVAGTSRANEIDSDASADVTVVGRLDELERAIAQEEDRHERDRASEKASGVKIEASTRSEGVGAAGHQALQYSSGREWRRRRHGR